eukprot:12286789-Alexandrium_andersonii.AAC.1
MRGGALPAARRFAQLVRARGPPGALRITRKWVLRVPDGPGWAAPRGRLTAATTALLGRGEGRRRLGALRQNWPVLRSHRLR